MFWIDWGSMNFKRNLTMIILVVVSLSLFFSWEALMKGGFILHPMLTWARIFAVLLFGVFMWIKFHRVAA